MHLRSATREDLPRIHAIRHGTSENKLNDPSRVSDAEVAWYLDHAVFLVVEDAGKLQGFVCGNHQTGYVWALFVAEEMQGRGYGPPSSTQRYRGSERPGTCRPSFRPKPERKPKRSIE